MKIKKKEYKHLKSRIDTLKSERNELIKEVENLKEKVREKDVDLNALLHGTPLAVAMTRNKYSVLSDIELNMWKGEHNNGNYNGLVNLVEDL